MSIGYTAARSRSRKTAIQVALKYGRYPVYRIEAATPSSQSRLGVHRDCKNIPCQGRMGRTKSPGAHLITHPSPMRQYRPSDITTAWPGPVRRRSPRMIAPLAMMVFPPSMMFCGPEMVALRETLFPVSCVCAYGQFIRALRQQSTPIHLPSQCTLHACSRWGDPWAVRKFKLEVDEEDKVCRRALGIGGRVDHARQPGCMRAAAHFSLCPP